MSRSLSADLRQVMARVRATVAGVPGWLGGLLAGLQAAVLSLLVVVAPAMAAVAAAPTAVGSMSVDWGGAIGVAAQLWLLAHGVPLVTAQATFTLVPLGLTVVNIAILVAVARRFATKSWGSWLLGVAAYGASVAAVALLVYRGAENVDQMVTRAAVIAVIIAAPSIAVGIWRAHGAEFTWIMSVPMLVRTSVRLSLGTVALLLAVASSIFVMWAFVGRQAIASAATDLGVDSVGGVALAVTETMYVPVMVVWMLAWLTGQGFNFGESNFFAPSAVATEALPTIPLLGALPSAEGGLLLWAPTLVVVAGAIGWGALRKRLPLGWHSLAVAALTTVMVGGLLAGLMTLASGSVGPGALAMAGPDAVGVAVVGAAWVGVGFVGAMVIQSARLFLFGPAEQEEPATPREPAAVS